MSNAEDEDTMREEYDFSAAVRGKHAETFARRKGVVVLAPDVVDVFPDAEAVNNALRLLIQAGRAVAHESKG